MLFIRIADRAGCDLVRTDLTVGVSGRMDWQSVQCSMASELLVTWRA